MEKLAKRLDACQRAMNTLDEILQMPFSVIVRDASIQRFEYTFESLWKLLKVYLQQEEGIVCNAPKRCFREALTAGLASAGEVESFLMMTDDRNLTSHTYIESLAEAIYRKLPEYLPKMKNLLATIQANVEAHENTDEDSKR